MHTVGLHTHASNTAMRVAPRASEAYECELHEETLSGAEYAAKPPWLKF